MTILRALVKRLGRHGACGVCGATEGQMARQNGRRICTECQEFFVWVEG